MTNNQSHFETYMAAWSESDADKQLASLKEVLAEESTYLDPTTSQKMKGVEAIQSHIRQAQVMIPGLNIKLKHFETHHDVSLAEWELCSGGAVMAKGKSFTRYSEEGKVVETVGFFAI